MATHISSIYPKSSPIFPPEIFDIIFSILSFPHSNIQPATPSTIHHHPSHSVLTSTRTLLQTSYTCKSWLHYSRKILFHTIKFRSQRDINKFLQIIESRYVTILPFIKTFEIVGPNWGRDLSGCNTFGRWLHSGKVEFPNVRRLEISGLRLGDDSRSDARLMEASTSGRIEDPLVKPVPVERLQTFNWDDPVSFFKPLFKNITSIQLFSCDFSCCHLQARFFASFPALEEMVLSSLDVYSSGKDPSSFGDNDDYIDPPVGLKSLKLSSPDAFPLCFSKKYPRQLKELHISKDGFPLQIADLLHTFASEGIELTHLNLGRGWAVQNWNLPKPINLCLHPQIRDLRIPYSSFSYLPTSLIHQVIKLPHLQKLVLHVKGDLDNGCSVHDYEWGLLDELLAKAIRLRFPEGEDSDDIPLKVTLDISPVGSSKRSWEREIEKEMKECWKKGVVRVRMG